MTKKDIKEISKMFAESNKVTKKLVQDSENRMVKKMRLVVAEGINNVANPATESMIKDSDEKMNAQIKNLKRELKEFKDDMLNKEDALMKEVKDFREEQTFGSHDIETLDEKYLDHEKRIAILEEKMA